MLVLYADGASRGNPGPASLGAAIYEGDEEIAAISMPLGIRTNNYAEYSAVLAGLEYVLVHKLGPKLLVRMDSKLVVEQLSGRWQIKHPELRELASAAFQLIRQLDVEFEWIPREKNSRADELANFALDADDSDLDSQLHQDQVGTRKLSEQQPKSIRAPRQSVEPTVLLVFRHGHTKSTESNLISGSKDNPELSELGLREAKSAAAHAESLLEQHGLSSPELIWHSDQIRAAQTAAEIAGYFGIEAKPDARLREISFGDWERVSMTELEHSQEKTVENWRGSVTVAPPRGESVAELEHRVLDAVTDLIENNPGRTVAIAAHMMPLRAIARYALNAGPSAHWSIQFAPGSVSIYRFFGKGFAEVFCLNSSPSEPKE